MAERDITDMPRLTDEELHQLEKFGHLGSPSPETLRRLVDEVKSWRVSTDPVAEYARSNQQERLKLSEEKLNLLTDEPKSLQSTLMAERTLWTERINKLQEMIDQWPK